MKLHSLFITLSLGLASTGALAASSAQSSNTGGPGGRPPGPPPEAIAACQGKSEGTQVSFTLRDGKTLTGVCRNQNGTLAAAPAGGPPGGGGGNPPPQ